MPESHRVNTLPSSQPILRFPGHEHPDLPLHAGVNGLCSDPDHDRALMITPGGGSSLIEFCVDARGLWLHVAEGVRCAQAVAALAARLPDVGVAVVPGAGHMVPLTHPTEVAGLVAVNLDRA